MAVGAGRRIIGEVGPTLGIGEGIDADANGDTDNHSKQDALDGVNLHLHLSLVRATACSLTSRWEKWIVRVRAY